MQKGNHRRETMWLASIAIAWILPALRAVQGAITDASVVPASLFAGVTGDVAVNFTTGFGVPLGGRVVVVFPTTFYVTSTTFTTTSGLDPASTLSMGANSFTVIITVDGAAIPPSTTVSFTNDGVTNPGEGTTSSYTIRTTDVNGNTLESTTSVPGSTIIKTELTDATLTPSASDAGALVQFTVSFTTACFLRIGSVIEVEFPTQSGSAFVIATASVASSVGLSSQSTVSSTGFPFLRVRIAGQDVSANTLITVVIGGIYNPAAQTLGTFSVRTRHSTAAIVQEKTGIAMPDIQSTPLASSTSIKPASFFAGVATTYVVTFANAAVFASGSRITVTFPARFHIAGATLLGVNNLPSTGTSLALLSSTQLRVTLGMGTVQAGVNRVLTFGNIINPGSSCDQYIYEYCSATWETYSIVIADFADQVYEDSTSVPGTPIVKKPMVFARVRPVLQEPFTTTPVVVSFTSQVVMIPLGGTIEVIFPAGYVLGAGVAASNHVGIPSASTSVTVLGQVISLTIAGASAPAAGLLSVAFSDITTPDSSAVGMYTVRTRDALGMILEEHDKINGEGCLYLNSCNGHGTCTLFSSRCICDEGWGADTDIASYRAPDCTQRTCPSGRSWNNVPTTVTSGSHNTLVECSAMGVCDRNTGRCLCYEGFEGNACQRLSCPNNCRGHGRCVSMRELARAKNGYPLSLPTSYGGLKTTTTWDEDMTFGCVCDSSWAVGTGAGEIQVTEYFGGDCSRRHCPTGDDPETTSDDTDCTDVAVPGGAGVSGNLCHVECSNRGICNFRTGLCQCFPGYLGFACQIKENQAS